MDNKKKLGVFDLVSVGVGSIIGAGLFSMLGTGIFYAGRALPLALVLAVLLVFFQYIRTIALTAVFPLSGGAYDQSALVLPPFFTGASALITIISNFSLSVMAVSIADYLAQIAPALASFQKLIAFWL